MSSLHDYYAFLEVPSDASAEEIKKAYRRLVRQFHPDTSKSPEANLRFHQIQEAYDVLSNEEKREQYDAQHRRYDGSADGVSTYRRNQHAADTSKSEPDPHALHDEEAERRWRVLQQYHGGTLHAQSGPDAEHGYARAPGNDSMRPTHPENESILQKLKRTVGGTIKGASKSNHAPNMGQRSAPIERPRVYQFTLNALESLTPTFREVALQGGDNPRVIRVKIPAGVKDDAVLKVSCPATDEYPAKKIEVRIRLEPHQFVERSGNDLTLKIPITVLEAMTGGEIEVPTLESPVRIRIPSPWTPEAVIKLGGKGIKESGRNGDLYIRMYVVLPEMVTEPSRQAAQVINELYTGNVRRHVPLVLNKAPK